MDTLFYDYKSIWETLNHQVLNHSFWLFSGLIASQRWKHSFTCNTCWRNSQQCLIKTFKACAFFASLQIPCKFPWKTFVAIMIWWLSLHWSNCFCHRFVKSPSSWRKRCNLLVLDTTRSDIETLQQKKGIVTSFMRVESDLFHSKFHELYLVKN